MAWFAFALFSIKVGDINHFSDLRGNKNYLHKSDISRYILQTQFCGKNKRPLSSPLFWTPFIC